MKMDIPTREAVARVLGDADIASEGTVALVNEEIEKAMQNGQQLDDDELVDHLRIYRQGYRDALTKVALAFGVVPHTWGMSQEDVCLPSIVDFRLLSWEL
ncbi:MAG: hypothetical protein GY832_26140 [Chloroflexi bacterium]|nr:hypothetical protein [Chloroflexota bacterium]